MPVPAFVNPDTIHRPSDLAIAPTEWGDQINDDLNNLYARSGQLLGSASYAPATATNYSITSPTLVAVDATNLAVPFVVGPTGNIIVKCSGGPTQPTSGDGGAIGVLIGSTPYTCLLVNSAKQTWYFDAHISGLTVGASLTAELAALCTPTGAFPLQISVGGSSLTGQIVVEVWAA